MGYAKDKTYRIYTYLVEPRNYADYAHKSALAVTREDLGDKIQFTIMRKFSENEKGELVRYKEDLALY